MLLVPETPTTAPEVPPYQEHPVRQPVDPSLASLDRELDRAMDRRDAKSWLDVIRAHRDLMAWLWQYVPERTRCRRLIGPNYCDVKPTSRECM
jgi:hypothetical protein